MQHADKDPPALTQFSWLWTPLAVLATLALVVVTIVATPVVFVVGQLSLPRAIKPLRAA